MFRSGLHRYAIEYLLNFPDDDVRRFGELYKDFFMTYKAKIPISHIGEF
jgi:hypothetical protein